MKLSLNKEWSGDPLSPPRDYPKVYVDAGETYKQYVCVIQRKGDSSGNIKWKCNFCATERVAPRLSIAAHYRPEIWIIASYELVDRLLPMLR
jgi:hypothetical protein